MPDVSTATPFGFLNIARLPGPSPNPGSPVPAYVVTTPAAVTLRIVLLPASATKTLPDESTAVDQGWLKRAAVPVPLTAAIEPPASVDTVYRDPVGVPGAPRTALALVAVVVAANPVPMALVAVIDSV